MCKMCVNGSVRDLLMYVWGQDNRKCQWGSQALVKPAAVRKRLFLCCDVLVLMGQQPPARPERFEESVSRERGVKHSLS